METIEKEIKKARGLLESIKKLQVEWDVLHKNNLINRAFWRIDKRLSNLWKQARTLSLSSYPICSEDDLLGYIEYWEIQRDRLLATPNK